MTTTETSGHLFTPYPVGPMPADVRHLPDDNLGRLELRLADRPREYPATVTDLLTGERFEVDRADCGAGCRCAAEARWIPAETAEACPKTGRSAAVCLDVSDNHAACPDLAAQVSR